MANANGWRRGDRVLHLGHKQHGIVEGWKGDKLLIFWGAMNGKQYRSWEDDYRCCWEPSPMDVLDKKGNVVARMEQEIVLPPENTEIVVDRQGGCDLSQYPQP